MEQLVLFGEVKESLTVKVIGFFFGEKALRD